MCLCSEGKRFTFFPIYTPVLVVLTEMAWESHNTKLACFSWDFSVSAHTSRDTTIFFFYFYLMVCLGAIIAQVRDGGDVDKKGVGMKIITAVIFGYFMCHCFGEVVYILVQMHNQYQFQSAISASSICWPFNFPEVNLIWPFDLLIYILCSPLHLCSEGG